MSTAKKPNANHNPESYTPKGIPVILSFAEKFKKIQELSIQSNSNLLNNNTRKILDDVLPVPYGDETCRFASCFTSMLMKIENYVSVK